MKHLTQAELLEAAESAQLPAPYARHFDECAACRSDGDALRAVLARAADDQMPEPSPLFWDHFAVRVSRAVRTESVAAEPSTWLGRLRRPLATWAVAAAASVLVILTVVWRATLHAPTVLRTPSQIVATNARPLPPAIAAVADNPDADERWAVVRIAAEDLAWEDVHAAGISATPAAVEGAAMELTADERSELARLLGVRPGSDH